MGSVSRGARAIFRGIRGWDELGRETFSIELHRIEYFGELKKSFLPDGYDFNIEIVSFGYSDKNDVGMPSHGVACKAFTLNDLETASSLVVKLVQSTSHSKDAPFAMRKTEKSHFKGEVFFRDGWAPRQGSE